MLSQQFYDRHFTLAHKTNVGYTAESSELTMAWYAYTWFLTRGIWMDVDFVNVGDYIQ